MVALTRRRSPVHRQECWQIYYGDIHAGTIIERVGNPHDTEPWEWRCGFLSRIARADFEGACRVFLFEAHGSRSGVARRTAHAKGRHSEACEA
jgi:hypothetical protein